MAEAAQGTEGGESSTGSTPQATTSNGAGGTGSNGAAPKHDVSIELDVLKRDLNEFRNKSTNYEKSIAEYQKSVQELTEQNTNLMKERGDKGGQKERQEYEEHLKGQYDKRYSGKLSELEQRIGEKEKALSEKDTELNHFRVITPAMGAAAKMFLPDALPLVQKEVASSCFWDEGEVRVKGADGKPLPSKNDPRFYMGIEEFLQQIVQTYPMLVPSQQIQGTKDAAGSSLRPAGSTTTRPGNWNQMDSNQRREWYRNNPDARRAELNG